MKEVLVSVIVPVYNTQDYLNRCVESLINQTYKNIEILLIDDGSKDSSMDICKKLERDDNRVKVFYSSMYLDKTENINMGQEATRNCGLKYANGEYVMFLDSDDTFTPDAVEKMVLTAKKYNADMVFSSFNAIVNNVITVCSANISEKKYSQEEFAKHCLSDIPYNLMSCIGSKIYKREFIEKNSLWFDKFYKYNEDGAFMLSALLKAENIVYVDFPFYNYFIRTSGSTQSSYRENMYGFISRTHVLLKTFFEKNKIFEQKKKEYSLLVINLVFISLINETKFKKYVDYKKVYKDIINDKKWQETEKNIGGVSRGQKIMLACMKLKAPWLLYKIIKIKLRRI